MDHLIYNLADSHLRTLADGAILSEEERAMAQRRGERYILTRSLLRCELARRLGCTPQDIRFRINEHGKPECEGIHFNISHSGDCFAMAFDHAPIGIDVERMRPLPRLESLAERIMCPQQLAAFCERGCPEDEFFTCWCATEALVKQAGASIWQAGRFPCLCEHGSIRLLPPTDTTVTIFTPMPGYRGAIACHPATAS